MKLLIFSDCEVNLFIIIDLKNDIQYEKYFFI